MSDCWAEPLGDCAGKMSREHIVTRGIFENDGTFVQGFPWCPQPTKISFVFVLYLEIEGLNKYIEMFDRDGKITPGMNMMYHPRAIRYTLPDPYLSHTLQINWK